MFPTDWLPVILEVSTIVGGLVFYMKNRQARDRLRNVRYANMLLGELNVVWATVVSVKECDHNDEILEPLSDNIYDGLVSSTNLSYFDADIQNLLYETYTSIKDFNTMFSSVRARVVVSGGLVFRPASQWPDPCDNEPSNNTSEDNARVELLSGILTGAEAAIYKVGEFRRRNKPARWLRLLKALHWYYDD